MRSGDAGCEPPRLGPLETQVMDLLWDEGASTIRGIIERLPGDFAYTTIATVLSNLQRKCLVDSGKKGRSTVYSARDTREEHVASVMDHLPETYLYTRGDSDLDLLRDYLRQRAGGGGR